MVDVSLVTGPRPGCRSKEELTIYSNVPLDCHMGSSGLLRWGVLIVAFMISINERGL